LPGIHDIISLTTGTTKDSWWTSRKIRDTWPGSRDD
jgi:hypothetical protein